MIDLPLPITCDDMLKDKILKNDNTNLPDIITRQQMYLSSLITGDTNVPEAFTRLDFFMKAAATKDITDLPEPITRSEMYWYAIATGYKDNIPEPITRADCYDYYLATYSAIREWLEVSGTKIVIPNSRQGYSKELGIRGRTLQNVLPNLNTFIRGGSTLGSKGEYVITPTGFKFKCLEQGSFITYTEKINLLKPNTVYTLICNANLGNNTSPTFLNLSPSTTQVIELKSGYNKVKFTIPNLDGKQNINIGNVGLYKVNEIVEIDNFYILEGDYTNTDLPNYIDGIESTGSKEGNKVSIQSRGKNLIPNSIAGFNLGEVFQLNCNTGQRRGITVVLPIKQGTTLTWSIAELRELGTVQGRGITVMVDYQDGTTVYPIRLTNTVKTLTYTFPKDVKQLYIYADNSSNTDYIVEVVKLQVEEGTVATEYQPYQTPHLAEWQLTEPLRSLPNAQVNNKVETILQDDNINLTYTGTWQVDNNPNYIGGSAKYTSTTGSKVAFSFVGNKLELYTSTFNNRGIAKITVDGIVYNVDMYAPIVNNNVKVFEVGGLAEGVHNVSIECTGNKNPNSSSSIVIIDYIKTYASITSSIDDVDKTGLETRRVGKVVLNGGINENWQKADTKTDTQVFNITINNMNTRIEQNVICDKFPVGIPGDVEKISSITSPNNVIYLAILKSKLATQDISGLKTWLQANPVTVLYELATPTTKQLTKQNIQTFDGGTTIECINNVPGDIMATVPITGSV